MGPEVALSGHCLPGWFPLEGRSQDRLGLLLGLASWGWGSQGDSSQSSRWALGGAGRPSRWQHAWLGQLETSVAVGTNARYGCLSCVISQSGGVQSCMRLESSPLSHRRSPT